MKSLKVGKTELTLKIYRRHSSENNIMSLFATSLSKLTISLTNYVRWHLLVLAPEDELERNMRTGLLRRTLGLMHYKNHQQKYF